jgi:hypothetical protein
VIRVRGAQMWGAIFGKAHGAEPKGGAAAVAMVGRGSNGCIIQ